MQPAKSLHELGASLENAEYTNHVIVIRILCYLFYFPVVASGVEVCNVEEKGGVFSFQDL